MQKTKENGLLGDRLTIKQPEKGYRAGIDPVFLAAFAKPDCHTLDLGCGVGTALLCLKARSPKTTGIGIEIQEHLATLATQNILYNFGENAEISVLQGDFQNTKSQITPCSFDQIIMNPPYFKEDSYFSDSRSSKNTEHMEGQTNTSLKDWISFANYALKPKGYINIIHRAERLDDIIQFLNKKKIGNIRIMPLFPYKNKNAKLTLVQGQKGSKTPLKIHSGIVLHDVDGEYTQTAKDILFKASNIK